ncbi:hypothetical protein PoB_004810400 [Plakobranchus ocellatus]|uniref:Uncharacterized protein n=1 Tax=Plakobranchus ocellatus TaxID=259542 RepID=A0AAV4BTA4_9GAST|nr:hypothetical protein PoB_004810400 [Plakobranchus ocellatus]
MNYYRVILFVNFLDDDGRKNACDFQNKSKVTRNTSLIVFLSASDIAYYYFCSPSLAASTFISFEKPSYQTDGNPELSGRRIAQRFRKRMEMIEPLTFRMVSERANNGTTVISFMCKMRQKKINYDLLNRDPNG